VGHVAHTGVMRLFYGVFIRGLKLNDRLEALGIDRWIALRYVIKKQG
jgi:hypothetical protein